MLITELPVLPPVSALDGTTFEIVFQCRLVSLSGSKRRLSQSQRQLLSMFNRSGQRAIARHLHRAQSKGLLQKTRESRGANPDEFVRGDFFARDTDESRDLVRLSTSLWGSKGLLRNWPFPSAWGHGCLAAAAIVILATLSALDEGISKKSLRAYISPLVRESSFHSGMRFIAEQHLAYHDNEGIKIATDWRSKIQVILDAKPACIERQLKGDRQRKKESERNRLRVARSELTDAERKQLLRLSCVVRGCERKAREIEHFPPMRFLKHLKVTTNRHFVWAICRRHNHEMQSFIKKLPAILDTPPTTLWLKPKTDPLRIYSAAANRWIVKFYEAFHVNDFAAAIEAVTTILSLWKGLAQCRSGHVEDIYRLSPIPQRGKGKRPYLPDGSQLTYRSG